MSNPFSTRREIDLAGLSVFIAMPSHRDIHPLVVSSLLETQLVCLERGIPIRIQVDYGGSLVHHARTKVAHSFLESDTNRIFWIDSDIHWKVNDFLRVLALSTKMDIVAGAYVAKQDHPLFMVKADLSALEGNEYGCLKFDGLGLGFTCMTREVVEKMAERAPLAKFHQLPEPIPHIFRFGECDGEAQGEDMAFFEDARKAGFDLWVDPNVELGHIGPKVYSAKLSNIIHRVPDDCGAVKEDSAVSSAA